LGCDPDAELMRRYAKGTVTRTEMRSGRKWFSKNAYPRVVPAKAGTHTPCPCFFRN